MYPSQRTHKQIQHISSLVKMKFDSDLISIELKDVYLYNYHNFMSCLP